MADTFMIQEPPMKLVRDFFDTKKTKAHFNSLLGNGSAAFLAIVMQLVEANQSLQIADIQSIFYAAENAAIVKLPLNNNLQFAHLLPYKDDATGLYYAQYEVGWRGYVQLALRSDKFAGINVSDVREGELIEIDRLTGHATFKWEQDSSKRAELPVTGFVSYFELLTGFKKSLYKTSTEIHAHAQRYSKTYDKAGSRWASDFNAMGSKTVIKEILNKWAPLSVEMAHAIQNDQAVITGGKTIYMDNPQEITQEEKEQNEISARAAQADSAEKSLLDRLKPKNQAKTKTKNTTK